MKQVSMAVAFLALCVAVAPTAAWACSVGFQDTPFVMAPAADDERVPTNTMVWLGDPMFFFHWGLQETANGPAVVQRWALHLVDSGGAEVDTTFEHSVQVGRLVPSVPLQPGETYTVLAKGAGASTWLGTTEDDPAYRVEEIGSFTVGEVPALFAPASPRLELVERVPGKLGKPGLCGGTASQPKRIVYSFAHEGTFLAWRGRAEGDSSPEDGFDVIRDADNLVGGGSLGVHRSKGQPDEVVVVSVDLAGNTSLPTTVPAFGCSTAGGAGGGLLLAFVLLAGVGRRWRW